MNQLTKEISPWVRFLLGAAISIAAFYFILNDLDFASLREEIGNVRWRYLFLGLLSVLLNNFSKGLRWHFLNQAAPNPPGFRDVFAQFIIGQAVNMMIPGRLGDVSRIQNVGISAGSRSYVAGTIGVEKLIDLIAYATLFGALFLFIPNPEWIGSPGVSMIAVAFLLILFLAGMARYWRKLVFIWVKIAVVLPDQIGELVRRGKDSLLSLDILKPSRYLFGIILLTVFVWGTAILNIYLLLQAVGIQVPFTASLLVLIALMAGINFSVVPGSIGVFEFVCVLALASYGVSQPAALGFGILLHAVVYLPIILIGVILMWLPNRMKFRPLQALGKKE